MRMWMVNPKNMCRKHLLGEHVELHMLVGSIKKKQSLQGFIKNKLIDTSKIQARHDALVKEMERRGYNHKSPLTYDDKLNLGKVNSKESYKELLRRCPDCRKIVETDQR